jgi:hypothetical protein
MRLVHSAALSVIVLACFSASAVHAHSQSSSRLYYEMSETRADALSVDLALIDLLQVIGLDRNADGSITWGELTSSHALLLDFVTGGIQVADGSAACGLTASEQDFSLTEYADVPYLRIDFSVDCPAGEQAGDHVVTYGLFFSINPAHRALMHVSGLSNDGVYVLSPANAELRVSAEGAASSTAYGFVVEGVRHILSGYDHLVFLLLLILPAAGRGPIPRRALRIGVIVTAFTVAHSITLAAATSGLIRLPAGPVEIGIAASIVVAAVINVVRPSHTLSWKIAFAFGLLHGFGFAGALAEMGLAREIMLVGLLAFNIGVELGQLLVVALIVPVLALLSLSAGYRTLLVPVASLACAALGIVWTAARL